MSEKCLDYNNVHNNLFNTTQLLSSEFAGTSNEGELINYFN